MAELNVFNSCDELDDLSEYAARNNHPTLQTHNYLDNNEYQGNYLMDNLFQDEDLMFLTPEEADHMLINNHPAVPEELFFLQMPPPVYIPEPKQVSPLIHANSDWFLLPSPSSLQNDSILNNLDSINFETDVFDNATDVIDDATDVIDQIEEAAPIETMDEDQELDLNIPVVAEKAFTKVVRRQPLQMVQQIIKYPAKKIAEVIVKKRSNKRKQVFEFPREDGIIFMSDDEEEDCECKSPPAKRLSLHQEVETIQETIEILDSPVKAPPVKSVPVVLITETPKSSRKKKKVNAVEGQKCPYCSKFFKRIVLHRCKQEPVSKIRLGFKCKVCNQTFQLKSALELHNSVDHGSLTCVHCKFVAKTKRGFQLHKLSCESTENLLNNKKDFGKLDVPILPDVKMLKKLRSSVRQM